MSRTSFAERFRTVAGVPPLTYLHRWRMLLAQRALRDGDARVGSLAFELGYASESAFSTAFKREVGVSPLRYRYRVRDELSAARRVGTGMTIAGTLDTRFSEATEPTPWADVDGLLESAELYWLTTVRRDGRPHVTPLVGIWVDESFVFCTGPAEQKARNLEHGSDVAVTTGVNSWQAGLDVIVEGAVERVTGKAALKALADVYRAKYGDDWDFAVDDEFFDPGRRRRVRVPGGADEGAGVRQGPARPDPVPLLTPKSLHSKRFYVPVLISRRPPGGRGRAACPRASRPRARPGWCGPVRPGRRVVAGARASTRPTGRLRRVRRSPCAP